MPEVKNDCFGYNPRTGGCVVLLETFCAKETCSFLEHCPNL